MKPSYHITLLLKVELLDFAYTSRLLDNYL